MQTSVNVDSKPDFSDLTVKKHVRANLILHGTCTRCAHCGQALTDSVSQERGLGPICSKNGYFENPVESDEMGAMITLSGYPELVNFLVKNYKKNEVRSLMNGLVKIASLNRRTKVHEVCCDAIYQLGYRNLASTLRQCLSSISVKISKEKPQHFLLWVYKHIYQYGSMTDLRSHNVEIRRTIKEKGVLIEFKHVDTLWKNLIEFYGGNYVKTPIETFRLPNEYEVDNKLQNIITI